MHRWTWTVAVLFTLGAIGVSRSGAGESPRKDTGAAYKHALELEAAGAKELARKAYEIVLGIDAEHRAARRSLGYEKIRGAWLRGDNLLRAKGFVRHNATWMTGEQFADATRPQRAAAAQRAGENRVLSLLSTVAAADGDSARKAKRRLAREDDRFKLAPLATALRCEPPALRMFAAQELARLKNPLAIPALVKRAVHDGDAGVRVAVVHALRKMNAPDTVHPLGRALHSRDAKVRVRAAQALGALGDSAGLGYLIQRWVGRSGDFLRAYFAQVGQLGYVQDFDVEVAKTSFIADPIIGVLQEGVAHPVRIHATEYSFTTIEQPAYANALKDLSGVDHGTDVNRWRRYWRENKARLGQERAERYRRRARR